MATILAATEGVFLTAASVDGPNGWRWADERHSVTTTFSSCQRTRYLPRPPSTGAEAPREMVADEETTIRRGPHEEYPRGTANGT